MNVKHLCDKGKIKHGIQHPKNSFKWKKTEIHSEENSKQYIQWLEGHRAVVVIQPGATVPLAESTRREGSQQAKRRERRLSSLMQHL